MSEDSVADVGKQIASFKVWLILSIAGGLVTLGGWSSVLAYRVSELETWRATQVLTVAQSQARFEAITGELGVVKEQSRANGEASRRIEDKLDRTLEGRK